MYEILIEIFNDANWWRLKDVWCKGCLNWGNRIWDYDIELAQLIQLWKRLQKDIRLLWTKRRIVESFNPNRIWWNQKRVKSLKSIHLKVLVRCRNEFVELIETVCQRSMNAKSKENPQKYDYFVWCMSILILKLDITQPNEWDFVVVDFQLMQLHLSDSLFILCDFKRWNLNVCIYQKYDDVIIGTNVDRDKNTAAQS